MNAAVDREVIEAQLKLLRLRVRRGIDVAASRAAIRRLTAKKQRDLTAVEAAWRREAREE